MSAVGVSPDLGVGAIVSAGVAKDGACRLGGRDLIEPVGGEAVVPVENESVGVGSGAEEEVAHVQRGGEVIDGEAIQGGAAAEVEANVYLEGVAIEAAQTEVVNLKQIGTADDVGAVLGVQNVLKDDRKRRESPSGGGEEESCGEGVH